MKLMQKIVPMTVVTLVALMAALPWEVDAAYHFLLPMITYAVIHAFVVNRPGSMPLLFIFAVGLATDILKSGPLGFWGLVWLSGILFTEISYREKSGFVERALLYLGAIGVMGPVGWAVASAYFLQIVGWRSIAIGFGGSWLVYLAVSILIGKRQGGTLPLAREGRGN